MTGIMLLIFALAMAVFGALILAMLHGLGFTIFGYKEIRPSYKKRFKLSLFTGILLTAPIYFVAGPMDVTSMENIVLMVVLYILIYIVVYHLTLSALTYFLYDAKGNKGAALKSPLPITVFSIVIYLLPGIYFASVM